MKYFSDRFECLKPTDCSMDKVEDDEFLVYQVAVLPETIKTAQRIDVTWHLISNMKDPVTGTRKFVNLSTIMNGILVILHSNADCERIFSLLTKNETDSGGSKGGLIGLSPPKQWRQPLKKSELFKGAKVC